MYQRALSQERTRLKLRVLIRVVPQPHLPGLSKIITNHRMFFREAAHQRVLSKAAVCPAMGRVAVHPRAREAIS
jgi:hypothetical protein